MKFKKDISNLSKEELIEIIRDIEVKLVSTQNKLDETEQLANLGHWELDIVNNTLYWSDEIYRIFNLQPQQFEATYEGFLNAIHPDDRALVDKAYSTSLVNKSDYNITHRLLLHNGQVKYVEERCHTEFALDGTPLRSIGTVLDITTQHLVEQERIIIKKLESVGVLAGGIAHDFNNILTAILGNIELAELYIEPTSEAFPLLIDSKKASLRAKDLTQQLLTFAKGGEPVKKDASIKSIITDSANFVLHGSSLTCNFNIPDDLWHVDIDKGQISQVIQNIIINARHAMPDGGVIQVSCQNIKDISKEALLVPQKKYIKITIADSGIGIPTKYLEKIFDPYFSTKQDGSGLGLAICHSIITKHSGNISVQSEKNMGTTFTIYLPASIHTTQNTTLPETNFVKTADKATIMIMDDDSMVRKMTKQMLIRSGYEILLTENGYETIKMYREYFKNNRPIDIVMMDLTIPGGMGGRDTLKEILQINPKAKVVVTSGYSNDPVMARYREYGFKASIAKPFQLSELNTLINFVLGDS